MIVEPLTRHMCSPIGDGAAAAIVVSERKAREVGLRKPVCVVTMIMHSGWNHADDEPDTVELTGQIQGRAAARQVEGARLALAQNGGGKSGNDAAAMVVTILQG